MAFASDIKRNEVAEYWTSPQTFATSLLILLVDEWGTQALNWEPETIRMEVARTYRVEMPQVNMDKLMGIIVLMTTDLFYRSVESFTHVANALNDSEADFQTWDPVEPDEAAWALTEAALVDPPPSGDELPEIYSDEVRRYVGVILDEDAIIQSPGILRIAIRDPRVKDAEQTFADDPVLFEAFYANNKRKVQEIRLYVKRRLERFVKELNDLPLQNRDPQTWQAFLNRAKRMLA